MNLRLIDAVLVASLGANLALAYVVHRERTPRVPPGPKVGSVVGDLTGIDDKGAAVTIPADPQGRQIVLYVFSQSCVWCQRSIPALQGLLPREKARYRFVAVDLTSPFWPSGPYLTANKLPFEETIHPDPETRARLGVSGTPTTLVLDADGRIEKVFDGALIGSTLDSASEFLAASLRADQPPASGLPVFKNGCTQDSLKFSFGSLICWQKHAYDCVPGKGWKDAGSGCEIGMYVAKERPGL